MPEGISVKHMINKALSSVSFVPVPFLSQKNESFTQEGQGLHPPWKPCGGRPLYIRMAFMDRQDLKAMSFEELSRFVTDLGWPRYRAEQIKQWLYAKGVTDIEAMTNLSREQRRLLAGAARISRLDVLTRLASADGTRKFLLGLEDGNRIEAVLIPDESRVRRRLTLCISSQVGCTLDCAFCLTGRMGLIRNLRAHEIVDQVLSVRRLLAENGPGERITNIVMMGMGEPLANFHAVTEAVRRLTDPKGVCFPRRRITLSTAGLVPQIRLLATLGLRVNLAVSLNAASDAVRNATMGTINRKYPLRDLIQACREYPTGPRERITFEYVLLEGVNDAAAEARRLVRLLQGVRCKVNLIPYNEHPGGRFRRPADAAVTAFQAILVNSGLTAFIRKSKGRDILAACGQLHSEPAAAPEHLLTPR